MDPIFPPEAFSPPDPPPMGSRPPDDRREPLARSSQAAEFARLFTHLIGEHLGLDALALVWVEPLQNMPLVVSWSNSQGTREPRPIPADLNADPDEIAKLLAEHLGVAWIQLLPLCTGPIVCGLLVLGGAEPKMLTPTERELLGHFQLVSGRLLAALPKASHLAQPIHRASTSRFVGKRRRLDNELRQIAHNPPDLILQVNPAGEILYANRSGKGFDAGQAVGMSVFDLLPKDTQRSARATLQRVIETGQRQEREILWRIGLDPPEWLDVRLSPVLHEEGAVASVVIMINTITRRKKRENALERYKLLSENAREIFLFIQAADGRIIDANQAALKAYGYSPDELTRLSIWDIRAAGEHDRIREQLSQANSRAITFETIHVRKNGETFPVEVSSQQIDLSGERMLMSIIRDISERRQAEDRLRRQIIENQRLLDVAQRRTQELEAIAQLSTDLRHAQSQAEILPLLAQKTAEAMSAPAAGIFLLEGSRLYLAAGCGEFSPQAGMRIPQMNGPLWDVVGTGKSIYLQSLISLPEQDPGNFFHSLADQLGAVALLPVKASENTIGILCIGYHSADNPFMLRSRLAGAFAEIAGNTLHRTSIREQLENLVANRAKDLEAVYDITAVATESLDLQVALQRALEHLLVATRCSGGAIFLLDETETYLDLFVQSGIPEEIQARIRQQGVDDSIEGWVIRHKEALIIPDLTADPRAAHMPYPELMLSLVAMPMRVQGQLVGAMSVINPTGHPFGIDELALLSAIADHLGLVVENARLHQHAETAAVMEERSRLARELHDSVTQSLYSLTLYANAGKALAQKGEGGQVQVTMAKMGEISQQALKEMRLLVYELRPTILDQDGLVGALQQRLDAVEARSGIQANIVAAGVPPLPLRVEEGLYRIALEALNNILKHARASQVTINIQPNDKDWLWMMIHDNGCGFVPAKLGGQGGMGLLCMHERADKLNGLLEIDSTPGVGTLVSVHVPLH